MPPAEEYGGGALRTRTPRGQVRSKGGGGAGRVSRLGGRELDRVLRLGRRCASLAARTLSCSSLGVPLTGSPGSPRASDSLTCNAFALLVFLKWSHTELERGPNWESKRKVASDG